MIDCIVLPRGWRIIAFWVTGGVNPPRPVIPSSGAAGEAEDESSPGVFMVNKEGSLQVPFVKNAHICSY